MTDSARYVKIVEWSEEDQAFVAQYPGIFWPFLGLQYVSPSPLAPG